MRGLKRSVRIFLFYLAVTVLFVPMAFMLIKPRRYGGSRNRGKKTGEGEARKEAEKEKVEEDYSKLI